MQILRSASIIAVSTIVACSDKPHTIDSVASNLMWVVSPNQDDHQGYLEAQKIARCAAEKARAAWNPKRYQSFNAELQIHAAEVELSLEAIERITVEEIEAGLFPERSEALDKQLVDFIPFLESCEEDVGGHGIEF